MLISDSNFCFTALGALLTVTAISSSCSVVKVSRLSAISWMAAVTCSGVASCWSAVIDSETVSRGVGGNVEVVVGFWRLLGVAVVGVAVVVGVVVTVVAVTVLVVVEFLGGCVAVVVGLFVVGGDVEDVDEEVAGGRDVVETAGRVVRGGGARVVEVVVVVVLVVVEVDSGTVVVNNVGKGVVDGSLIGKVLLVVVHISSVVVVSWIVVVVFSTVVVVSSTVVDVLVVGAFVTPSISSS